MKMRTDSKVLLVALGGAALVGVRVAARAPAQTATAQKHSATSAAAPALKTPWGTPDLQGAWSSVAVVPFERPKEFGNREFKTDAEYKKALDDLLERDKRIGRDSRESNGQDISAARPKMWRAPITSTPGSATSP